MLTKKERFTEKKGQNEQVDSLCTDKDAIVDGRLKRGDGFDVDIESRENGLVHLIWGTGPCNGRIPLNRFPADRVWSADDLPMFGENAKARDSEVCPVTFPLLCMKLSALCLHNSGRNIFGDPYNFQWSYFDVQQHSFWKFSTYSDNVIAFESRTVVFLVYNLVV